MADRPVRQTGSCAHALFFTALSLSRTPRCLGRFFVHVFSEEQLFMVFKHAMAILKVDWVDLPNEGASKSRDYDRKIPLAMENDNSR